MEEEGPVPHWGMRTAQFRGLDLILWGAVPVQQGV